MNGRRAFLAGLGAVLVSAGASALPARAHHKPNHTRGGGGQGKGKGPKDRPPPAPDPESEPEPEPDPDPVQPPVNITPPSVPTSATVGQQLTATPGTWQDAAFIQNQWQVELT